MARIFKMGLFFTITSIIMLSMLATNGYSKKSTYVLGADFSISGRASFLGDPEAKTVRLLVSEINAKGGINGHQLKVIIYDDEGNATKARLNFERLIKQDHVLALLGPSLSGISFAVIDLAKRYKTPLVSCASSDRIIINPRTGKTRKWVFKTPQSNALAAKKIFGFMKKRGIKRIAITTITTGFGASGRKALIKYAPQYGIKIVADEKYGPKDTDMSVQLTKIKGTNAQAIVNWSIGPSQVIVTRQWKQLGLSKHMLLFQSHGFGDRRNIKLSGGAAEGVYLPLGKVNIGRILPASDPQKKPIMAYIRSYEKRYHKPISSFGGHAYDALMLVVHALKAVGPNRAKIRSYIEHTKNYVGMHGIFNFSPTDHNGLTEAAFVMVVVKNGDWAIAK